MKDFFLVGSAQALFLTILLLSKKNKIAADYILSSWLIALALPLFLYYYNYQEYSDILNRSVTKPTWLMIVNVPLLLIQSPFLYIYVNSVLKGKKKFNPIYLLHFIPVLLFIIAYYVIIDEIPSEKENFDIHQYKFYPIIISFFPLIILLAVYYIVKSFIRVRKYQKKILKHFSYTESIDFKWLKNLIIINMIVWIILFILVFLFSKYDLLIQIHNIILIAVSIAVFLLGYFGFLRTDVFITQFKQIDKQIKSYPHKKKETTINPEVENQINALRSFMENEKPFLENKLTIKQLADMLELQPYQLSILLNDVLNKNFFDFVNEYRVEEVKKQMKVNKTYTLMGIAYDCGFNSKSSFNRIFKNVTGFTPSEFQKASII
jgi:AraC-like DNA-binding protein